jgi:hypothetical protein
VQRDPGQHPRIIVRQLGAEVQPLLQIRSAGGELGADREVAPPGPAAALHGNLQLVRQRQREELGARLGQLRQQPGRHTMAGQVEKAALAAGLLDLPGHNSPRRSRRTTGQRTHIDDRQHGRTSRTCHQSILPEARCRRDVIPADPRTMATSHTHGWRFTKRVSTPDVS